MNSADDFGPRIVFLLRAFKELQKNPKDQALEDITNSSTQRLIKRNARWAKLKKEHKQAAKEATEIHFKPQKEHP